MNADYLECNDGPTDTIADTEAFLARCKSRRAARVRKPSLWDGSFDAPDAGQLSHAMAQTILEAAVKTPAQVILATATASVTFTPKGDKVRVVSRGVENWGTRILAVGEARLLYRKLVQAGFVVW
jgi:hypothetical protein